MYTLNGQYPVWDQIQVAIRGTTLISGMQGQSDDDRRAGSMSAGCRGLNRGQGLELNLNRALIGAAQTSIPIRRNHHSLTSHWVGLLYDRTERGSGDARDL